MTPQETLALVQIAAVAHDKAVPEGMAEIWHATLHDLPFGDARAALLEVLKVQPFWPKPADIRRQADELVRDRLRALRQQKEHLAIEAEYARRQTVQDRSADVSRLLAEVRVKLPDTGRDVIRARQVEWERQRRDWERAHKAAANPKYDPAALGRLAQLDAELTDGAEQ